MILSKMFQFGCLSVLASSLFISGGQAQQMELHEVWSLSPGDRDYITTTDRQRGLAVHPTEGYVLLVHRPGAGQAPVVAVLDGLTGEETGTLSTAGVSVGHANDFLLSKIAISDDGAIYASNLKVNDANNYRIYRWADKDADPELIYDAQLNSTDAVVNNRRFGDSLAVRGSGMDTEILLSNWTGAVWARLTPLPAEEIVDPNNKFAAQVFALTDIGAGEMRDLAWGPDDLVYGSRVTKHFYEVDYQPEVPSSTLVRSFDGAILPIGLGPVGTELSEGWLGAIDVAAHRFYLFDISALTTGSTVPPVASRLFPTLNTNGNGVGAVAFGNGLIYALDTNNGVMAMELVEVQEAPVQVGEVLWTNPDTIMGVQRNGDNRRTHAAGFTRAIGVAVDPVAEQIFFADDTAGTIGRVNFDGTGQTNVASGTTVQFLALTDDRVFWTEYSTGLWSAARDGTDVQHVMDVATNGTSAMLIDEDAGKVYMASAGGGQLYRSNLDGQEFETVSHITLAAGTYGLALDRVRGILYASNYNVSGSITAYDMDTGASEVLYAGRPHPLGIALSEDGGRLFWAERNDLAQISTSGRVLTAPAYANGQVRALATGLNSPFGVALVPQPLGAFEGWLAPFGVAANQLSPTDDPDGDGVSNLAEYALDGGDPTMPDLSILPLTGFVAGDDEETYLTLLTPKNASASGIDYIVEVSSDLVNWNSGEGHVIVLNSTGTDLTVRDNTPLTSANRRFIRLRVEKQ